jgi:hypothetical protein
MSSRGSFQNIVIILLVFQFNSLLTNVLQHIGIHIFLLFGCRVGTISEFIVVRYLIPILFPPKKNSLQIRATKKRVNFPHKMAMRWARVFVIKSNYKLKCSFRFQALLYAVLRLGQISVFIKKKSKL